MTSPSLLFRVTYGRLQDLRQDVEQQLGYGGFLVRVADQLAGLAPPLQPGEAAQLELVLPSGASVAVAAQALQVVGPAVALAVAPTQLGPLHEALKKERPADAGAAPRCEVLRPAAPAPAPAAPKAAIPGQREGLIAAQKKMEAMSSAEKTQLALHGDQDERSAILRDRNKSLHPYVLRNPGISPEEVLAIAKNPQSTTELLEIIGGRKEWIGRASIALALVRNAKTPPAIGVRALDHINPADLRLIAKSENAPTHIIGAARKKLLR